MLRDNSEEDFAVDLDGVGCFWLLGGEGIPTRILMGILMRMGIGIWMCFMSSREIVKS